MSIWVQYRICILYEKHFHRISYSVYNTFYVLARVKFGIVYPAHNIIVVWNGRIQRRLQCQPPSSLECVQKSAPLFGLKVVQISIRCDAIFLHTQLSRRKGTKIKRNTFYICFLSRQIQNNRDTDWTRYIFLFWRLFTNEIPVLFYTVTIKTWMFGMPNKSWI